MPSFKLYVCKTCRYVFIFGGINLKKCKCPKCKSKNLYLSQHNSWIN